MPAQARHSRSTPSYQPKPVIAAQARHTSEGWYPKQIDSRLRENDEIAGFVRMTIFPPSQLRHTSEGWYPKQIDSRLRENDKITGFARMTRLPASQLRHTSEGWYPK